MKSAVIVFPASNCDRDAQVALTDLTGTKPFMVWHADTDVPDVDLIVLPGGFSYGDYLRCGAMAAQSHIMRDVKKKADAGVAVLGICNGFQVLTEAGLLPGALQKNQGLRFLCTMAEVRVETDRSALTTGVAVGTVLRIPINHFEGNYICSAETLAVLQAEDRIVLRYMDNPNGSIDSIAGVCNEARNVVGLMPHPERATDELLGSVDGAALLRSLLSSVAA